MTSLDRAAIDPSAIDRATIAGIYPLIATHLRRTPVLEVSPGVTLKLEHLQHSGSFKARGALTNLLTRDVPAAGVVAASGGNHGCAVAWAARRLGVPARVYVPTTSSPAKIERIRGYGAELVLAGERYAGALAASLEYEARTGALPVHAFDSPQTMLGQGSVGLELEAQTVREGDGAGTEPGRRLDTEPGRRGIDTVPDRGIDTVPDRGIDTVLVAVGGGGLIGGIAAWFAPTATRVIGVEPYGAPSLHDAMRAGRPVDTATDGIAADALAPARIGELTFAVASSAVAAAVLVTDDGIVAARRALWEQARIVVEPAGACAYAALLTGVYVPEPGERVAVILSGANTTIDL